MDYVYTCRQGNNEELRYSLRSIEQNMPAGRVWVIGYRPDWYIGDFIQVKDVGNKFENIKNCISKIIKNNDISNNFILMNDDFFALKKNNSIINYHGGSLENKIIRYKEKRMSPKYIKLLELTLKELKNNGIENPIDYDIHVPMTMDKKMLEKALDFAFFPRSSYGNLTKLQAVEISDVKIYSRDGKIQWNNVVNNNFVSTEDTSFTLLKQNVLNKMFNNKSSLENPNY